MNSEQQPGYPAPPPQPVEHRESQPSQQQAAYDFILNPQKPPKPSAFGNNQTLKIVSLCVGLLAIIVIGLVLVLSIFGSKTGSNEAYISLAQEQQELIRISTQANSIVKTDEARRLAIAIQLSITSDQQATLSYISSRKQEVPPKILALKQNAKTDQTLTDAKATSTYDQAFVTVIQQELDNYGGTLKTALKAAPGPKGKALVNKQLEHAQLLYEQSVQIKL